MTALYKNLAADAFWIYISKKKISLCKKDISNKHIKSE